MKNDRIVIRVKWGFTLSLESFAIRNERLEYPDIFMKGKTCIPIQQDI